MTWLWQLLGKWESDHWEDPLRNKECPMHVLALRGLIPWV